MFELREQAESGFDTVCSRGPVCMCHDCVMSRSYFYLGELIDPVTEGVVPDGNSDDILTRSLKIDSTSDVRSLFRWESEPENDDPNAESWRSSLEYVQKWVQKYDKRKKKEVWVKIEGIEEIDFNEEPPSERDYWLGHQRAIFSQLRVWDSNGILNVGSCLVLGVDDNLRAACRYCGKMLTFATCLAHVDNNERLAQELFTVMTLGHGYFEISQKIKELSPQKVDTSAVWSNYATSVA